MKKKDIVLLIITILIVWSTIHWCYKHTEENVLKSWYEFNVKNSHENTRMNLYRDIKRITNNLTASQVHEMLGNDNFDIYIKYRKNLASIHIKCLDGKSYDDNRYIYYLGSELDWLLSYEYFLIVYYKDEDDPILGVQFLKLAD